MILTEEIGPEQAGFILIYLARHNHARLQLRYRWGHLVTGD